MADFIKGIDTIRDDYQDVFQPQQRYIETGNVRHLLHPAITADELCQDSSGAPSGDTTAPTVITSIPPANQEITENRFSIYRPSLTFSEPVKIVGGTISLERLSDNVILQSWDISASSLVYLIVGAYTLFINDIITLTEGEDYRMNLPAGFVTDLAGNAATPINWIFSTESVAAISGDFSDDFSDDF